MHTADRRAICCSGVVVAVVVVVIVVAVVRDSKVAVCLFLVCLKNIYDRPSRPVDLS